VKQAEGAAKARVVNANAEAESIKLVAGANAEQTSKVGLAEAEVIKQKAAAVNIDSYTAIKVAEAIAQSKQPLVPQVVAGGEKGSTSTLVETLLALIVKSKALPDAN
jgi:regulator of protease activity HflC (stomatin/prohibitin superfamily)